MKAVIPLGFVGCQDLVNKPEETLIAALASTGVGMHLQLPKDLIAMRVKKVSETSQATRLRVHRVCHRGARGGPRQLAGGPGDSHGLRRFHVRVVSGAAAPGPDPPPPSGGADQSAVLADPLRPIPPAVWLQGAPDGNVVRR